MNCLLNDLSDALAVDHIVPAHARSRPF